MYHLTPADGCVTQRHDSVRIRSFDDASTGWIGVRRRFSVATSGGESAHLAC